MAKSTGGKPKVGKLTGKGSSRGKIGGGKGTNNSFPAGTVPTAPAGSGNADVVQQRAAQVTQGAMEMKQLRKNKSTGLKAGKR